MNRDNRSPLEIIVGLTHDAPMNPRNYTTNSKYIRYVRSPTSTIHTPIDKHKFDKRCNQAYILTIYESFCNIFFFKLRIRYSKRLEDEHGI